MPLASALPLGPSWFPAAPTACLPPVLSPSLDARQLSLVSSLTWLEWPLNVWGQNHIPRSTHSCSVVFLWFSRAPWRMNPRGKGVSIVLSVVLKLKAYVCHLTLSGNSCTFCKQFVQGDTGRGFQDQVFGCLGEKCLPPLLPDLLSNRGMIYTNSRLYHLHVGILCFLLA